MSEEINNLKGIFANVNDDMLLRDCGNLYAENKQLQQENQQLKERINKIDKHVSSLCSVGRGCEIYADVKREILKVVRGDNK